MLIKSKTTYSRLDVLYHVITLIDLLLLKISVFVCNLASKNDS